MAGNVDASPFGSTSHAVTLSADGAYVIKRYRSANRGEPEREWVVLRLLHRHARDLAPEPISMEFHSGQETITMRRLPGWPMRGEPLNSADLRQICMSLDRLHGGVPHAELHRLPLVGLGPMLDRTRRTLRRTPMSEPLIRRAQEAALRWHQSSEAAGLMRAFGTTVLGRADHNLSNFLRAENTVRLVDFEDAGRINRTCEYAELVEHVSARTTADSMWDELLDRLDFTPAERGRLRAERRLVASFWFSLLLPGQPGSALNPPGTLQCQAQRLLTLLD